MLEETLRGRGMTPYEAQLRAELRERRDRMATAVREASARAARSSASPPVRQLFFPFTSFVPPAIVDPPKRSLAWDRVDWRYFYVSAHAILDALEAVPHAIGQKTTLGKIIVLVCLAYQISRVDLTSQRRQARVSHARQIAMWLAKEFTPLSLPQIGIILGDRDHTTILHGIRVIQSARDTNHAFADELDALKAVLTGGVI